MSFDRSLSALNGHIHDQIMRLTNPDLSNEELETELKRSKALSDLASQSVNIANTVLRASELYAQEEKPKMLE